MNNIRIYGIIILLFMANSLFAQSTWQTAQTISHNSTTTITSTNSNYWFSFIAQTNQISAVAGPANSTSEAAITNLELYELIGSSISLLQSVTRDTTSDFTYKNLIIGNTYFIKVVNNNPPDQWKLWSTGTTIIVYNDDDCAPPCNNIIFNGGFESTDSKTVLPNTLINTLSQHPFRNYVLDVNGVFGGGTYQNLVCHWKHVVEQGNILYFGLSRIFTSQTVTVFSGSYGARLTASCSDNNGFPIYNNIHIENGKSYNISFNYKVSSSANNGQFKFGFSPIANPSNLANFSSPQGPLVIYNSTSWSPVSFLYNATQDFESLVIYAHNTTAPNSCWDTYCYIDDIVITPVLPPLEQPIFSGPTTTCDPDQFGDLIYTITNYNPTFVYMYKINGGLTQIAHSNTFTINISEFTQQENHITMWNSCDGTGNLTVYECCEPVGYTLFFDENLTLAKVNAISNSKMVINGTVNVSEDISLTNFDIKFGPMAKLIIDDNNDFTMDGGSLEDGCNYPWDGIYIDNSDATVSSKLKLNGLTLIKGAFSAVVSSNNAEIELTNNTFLNNDICVKIRNYKPNLCDPVPFGQPPTYVPPYSAIITGNTFEIDNSPYYYHGYNYGIQIDTVYDITIGDENAVKNIFKKVHIGIKTNSSWVKIYNNRFENICNTTGSNPIPIVHPQSGKPINYIAIMADKFIGTANQSTNYPIRYSTECTISNIIVGKVGTNGGNEFENCDFGIYAHKHFAEIINNDFTNQISSAVWVWDARSKVNDNNIQQKAGIWFYNDNLNTAILIQKTFKTEVTYNWQIAEVKNNSISNVRTGISLVNCSSMPFNSLIKTMVKDNDITFDYYSAPSYYGGYKYTGIWLSACNRAVIYGNEVNNTSGTTVSTSYYRSLIGIRIDKTREAQVSHNFNLNYLGTGIWINGDCHNTQLFCNTFKAGKKGIYTFTPSNSSGFAAVLLDQGNLTRPQDNFFQQMQGPFVSGLLNTAPNNSFNTKWYYRNTNAGYVIANIDNHVGWTINITSQTPSCTGGIIPPPDPTDDEYATYIDEMYGPIVRNEMDYIELEDEFEYFDDEYLYEVLYNNPEIMNLGEPDDTAYANFYTYLTNSNVREFIDVQELINADDINQALMDNGAIVAQNVIEANKKYVTDVYLNSFAQDKYFTESQRQTLQTIAMLTPYIGGDAVYSARVMLGINPNTYNLAYRIGNFSDSNSVVIEDNILKTFPNPVEDRLTLEFVYPLEVSSVFTLFDVMGRKVLEIQLSAGNNEFTINTSVLENGIYFYILSTDDKAKGKIIINN